MRRRFGSDRQQQPSLAATRLNYKLHIVKFFLLRKYYVFRSLNFVPLFGTVSYEPVSFRLVLFSESEKTNKGEKDFRQSKHIENKGRAGVVEW